jgi:predicted N-acetyltransferase YhbS
MSELRVYRGVDLRPADIEAIVRLIDVVWPSKDKTFRERVATTRARVEENIRSGLEVVRFVVWEGSSVVAHARTFPRKVHAPQREFTVMALAGVCVLPELRKKGLGRVVVERAFDRIDCGEFPVSLFQTSVPGFYLKLGAREVTNKFVSKLNKDDPDARPWWDPNVMIYPADVGWPTGVIDLNGPAY